MPSDIVGKKKSVVENAQERFYLKFDAFSFQNVFQYLVDFACKMREQCFYT